eukprot:CAMPEP_0114989550 /NCGR_PEP_ID=MMETSP0216-20121206/10263_1 /TAXON_ID=223996 /ORGANISM="Protocruzia adherens, Strain Boccale" /LENGTH=130 /DNA_ID=CAMNT_0002352547 /DNA_START=165 /DNA_END=554 /DNA_ORIENTATION=+
MEELNKVHSKNSELPDLSSPGLDQMRWKTAGKALLKLVTQVYIPGYLSDNAWDSYLGQEIDDAWVQSFNLKKLKTDIATYAAMPSTQYSTLKFKCRSNNVGYILPWKPETEGAIWSSNSVPKTDSKPHGG